MLFFSGLGNLTQMASRSLSGGFMMDSVESMVYSEKAYYPGAVGSADFAPDVQERKIVTTTSMSTEVKRGEFDSAAAKLKSIASASDSFILSENVNKYGTKRKAYFVGSYQVKVDVEKYDFKVIKQGQLLKKYTLIYN